MDVKILRGTDNLSDALLVRDRVFTNEQGFKNPDSDEFDTISFHVVIYDSDKPVATGRCFSDPDTPAHWHIGRICVLREKRGHNLGRAVMRHLDDLAIQNGAIQLELSAQLYAIPFYKKCGYAPTGERSFDEFCEHELMVKKFQCDL